jgi:hypothetical protein
MIRVALLSLCGCGSFLIFAYACGCPAGAERDGCAAACVVLGAVAFCAAVTGKRGAL